MIVEALMPSGGWVPPPNGNAVQYTEQEAQDWKAFNSAAQPILRDFPLHEVVLGFTALSLKAKSITVIDGNTFEVKGYWKYGYKPESKAAVLALLQTMMP